MRKLRAMAEPLIERAEIVALLFNVSDIANAQRTRELAERAQAKLDAQSKSE